MTSGDCSWKIARLWFWWCCAWEAEQRRPDQIIPRIDDAAWGFWCWRGEYVEVRIWSQNWSKKASIWSQNWPKKVGIWMSELTEVGEFLESELTKEGNWPKKASIWSQNWPKAGGEYLDSELTEEGEYLGGRTDWGRLVFGVRTDRRGRVFGFRTDRRRRVFGCQNWPTEASIWRSETICEARARHMLLSESAPARCTWMINRLSQQHLYCIARILTLSTRRIAPQQQRAK